MPSSQTLPIMTLWVLGATDTVSKYMWMMMYEKYIGVALVEIEQE